MTPPSFAFTALALAWLPVLTTQRLPLTMIPPNPLAAHTELSSSDVLENVAMSRSSPLTVQLPSSRAYNVGDIEEYPVQPIRDASAEGEGGALG
jgi:hypothetical protein